MPFSSVFDFLFGCPTMKNLMIFCYKNSDNKHAKKTDANHLSKQKYSVAKISDIRNGLLQFHEKNFRAVFNADEKSIS